MSRLGDGLRANPIITLIAGVAVLIGAAATFLEDFGTVRTETVALVCGDEAEICGKRVADAREALEKALAEDHAKAMKDLSDGHDAALSELRAERDDLRIRVEGLEDQVSIFQRVGFRQDGEATVDLGELYTRDRQEAIERGARSLFGGRVYTLAGESYRHHEIPSGASVFLLNLEVDVDDTPPPGAPREHLWLMDDFTPVTWHYQRPDPSAAPDAAEAEQGPDPYVRRIAPFAAIRETDARALPCVEEGVPGDGTPACAMSVEKRAEYYAREMFFEAITNKLRTADTLLVDLKLHRVQEIEGAVYFAQFRASGWARFGDGDGPAELLDVREILVITAADDRIYTIKSAYGTSADPDGGDGALPGSHKPLVLSWWKALRIIN